VTRSGFPVATKPNRERKVVPVREGGLVFLVVGSVPIRAPYPYGGGTRLSLQRASARVYRYAGPGSPGGLPPRNKPSISMTGFLSMSPHCTAFVSTAWSLITQGVTLR
jgi:hypothetical protein